MPKTLAWLSPKDPVFPPNLTNHLGDKTPKRIVALGNLEILNSKAVALIRSVESGSNPFDRLTVSACLRAPTQDRETGGAEAWAAPPLLGSEAARLSNPGAEGMSRQAFS